MTPRQYHEQFDYLYRTIGQRGLDPCTYCGVVSDTYDHVPPLAIVATLDELEIDYRRPTKYCACHQCNSWLGSRHLLTLKERRAYIRTKLRQKYAKFLRMPVWSEEELETLSGNLADDIRRAMRFANEIRARIGHART